MAKILYIVLGILGLLFLIGFGMWFTKHPISRDKVLLKFDKKYFVLVASVVLAYLLVIAGLVSLEWIEAIRPDGAFKIALKYGLKMHEAKEGTNGQDLNIFAFIIIMLFQVVVVEGLVLAAIVGWTNRRIERLQKGQVRYTVDDLSGRFVSIWDDCDENLKCYQLYWKRFTKYIFKQKVQKNSYAVVVGANEVAPSVIKNLLMHEDAKKNSLNYTHEEENQYVVLQSCSDIEQVRQILRAYLTEEEYSRVIIYSDIRYSYEGLKALHLDGASEIYVLGENTTIDGGETYHDTMNMRCVNIMAQILGNRGDDLKVCKVLFEYQTTYSVFQFSDVTQEVNQAMHFIPFNRYESWARRVMVDNKALALVDENTNSKSNQQINYTPLDGFKGIKPKDTQRVHFIVVGMSKMGVAMGTQALYQAHYPNYVRDNSLKSRITFIDANAEQEMDFFKGRYASLFELARHRYIDAKECKDDQLNSDYQWIDPMLDPKTKWKHLSAEGANFLDVEIEFVKGELESEKVREYLRQVTADKNSKVTIAICLPLTHQSVAAALYMPNEVYDNVQEIWVYQREAADIIQNLTQGKKEDLNIRYNKLKPFGMLYGEYIDSRTYYLKALLVNGIYDIEDVDNPMYSSNLDMGDKKSFKPLRTSWNKLTVEKTWSNKYFVDTIYQKIRSTDLALSEEAAIIGYNNDKFFTRNWKEDLDNALYELSNLELDEMDKKKYLAECEHNRWNVQQLLLGFRPADIQEDEDICKRQEQVKRDVAPIKEEINNYMNDNNIQRLKELNDRIQYTKGDVKAKSFKSLLKFIEANAKLEVDAELLDEIKEMAQKEKDIAAIKESLEKEKKDMKSPMRKVHYCICDFDHLEAVDPGAKGYDEKLNNGIPKILELVDSYHCSTEQ